MLKPGRNDIRYDALVAVSSTPENQGAPGVLPVPVYELPAELLRYTLPSRYCDSDKLFDFAWKHFGQIANGHERVQAICDWVHNNIEYRYGSGQPDLSASEVIEQRYGVCRDFAHVVVALCRTFNLPARYVSGHLPDIGFVVSSHPEDFHANCEVYLGGRWKRHNSSQARLRVFSKARSISEAIPARATQLRERATLSWSPQNSSRLIFLIKLGELLKIDELQLLKLSDAKIDVTIRNERVQVDDIILKSDNPILRGSGPIRFNGKMNLGARLLVNLKLQHQLRGVLGEDLVDSEDPEYRQIPFSVTGRIDNPKTDLLDKLIWAKVGQDVGGMLVNILRSSVPQKSEDKKKTSEN